MAVTKLNQNDADAKRQRSEHKFPYYDLADSLLVAKTIHAKGGGAVTLDELAAHLGYAGTNNGAFQSRVGAARMFGVVEKTGNKFVLTQLAQSILMPVYDWMPKEGLVKAFLNVELFRRVYEEYQGKQLPPEFGIKNALKTIFKVNPNGIERAYRTLMLSAEAAGFFETRAGARTHLIIPTINKGAVPTMPSASPNENLATPEFGGGGGGSGSGSGGSESGGAGPTTLETVKARYIQTLITTLEEKGKKGDLDEALMTRIEKLLAIQ
jgi:hypothetical protein